MIGVTDEPFPDDYPGHDGLGCCLDSPPTTWKLAFVLSTPPLRPDLRRWPQRCNARLECQFGEDKAERVVIYTRGESILVERLATDSKSEEQVPTLLRCSAIRRRGSFHSPGFRPSDRWS